MDSKDFFGKIKFDPTISLGHLGSIIIVAFFATGAWYQLSNKVDNNQEIAKIRFDSISSTLAATDLKNKEQDLAIKELGVELKSEMRSNTQEIKSELRDMRRR